MLEKTIDQGAILRISPELMEDRLTRGFPLPDDTISHGSWCGKDGKYFCFLIDHPSFPETSENHRYPFVSVVFERDEDGNAIFKEWQF